LMEKEILQIDCIVCGEGGIVEKFLEDYGIPVDLTMGKARV